jgi:hypothetical protein
MDPVEQSRPLSRYRRYAAAKPHRAAAQHVAEQSGGDGQGLRTSGSLCGAGPSSPQRKFAKSREQYKNVLLAVAVTDRIMGSTSWQKAAGGVGNGIGVCMAANRGCQGSPLARRPGCYRAVGCLPGVTDAGRVCVYLVEDLFPGRAAPQPRGRSLCDGLGPAASLMRVPGMRPAGRLAMAKAKTGTDSVWKRRRESLRRRRTTRGWRLTASLLVSSTGLTPARSPRGWLPMRR